MLFQSQVALIQCLNKAKAHLVLLNFLVDVAFFSQGKVANFLNTKAGEALFSHISSIVYGLTKMMKFQHQSVDRLAEKVI